MSRVAKKFMLMVTDLVFPPGHFRKTLIKQEEDFTTAIFKP